MSATPDGEIFTATHMFEYTYHRSVGEIMGRFFTALRERRVIGAKSPDGRVIVPPVEYDPDTGASIDETVDVASVGTVTTWSWVNQPRPRQPLSHPFAWALIRLDGADTPMLHAVDAGNESTMQTGMRVRIRWREETEGHIHDIVCFEPETPE